MDRAPRVELGTSTRAGRWGRARVASRRDSLSGEGAVVEAVDQVEPGPSGAKSCRGLPILCLTRGQPPSGRGPVRGCGLEQVVDHTALRTE
jgi:hypothetical protein